MRESELTAHPAALVVLDPLYLAARGCPVQVPPVGPDRPAGHADVKQSGDRLAQAGHPLKPRTIQTALGQLEAAGLAAASEEGNGRARYWSPATPDPIDNAGREAGMA